MPKGKFDHVSVGVLTEGTLSDEHFDHTTSHSRNVSNDNREELGKMLTCSSAINYHYDLFKDSKSLEVAKHGNLNQLQSQEVLRKVKSQYMEKKRFSDDIWQDIVITKKLTTVLLRGKN